MTPDPVEAKQYNGQETDLAPVPTWTTRDIRDPRVGKAPDQATLLADAVTLAYCQPYVSAFFNFHLADTARGRRILSSGDTFTDAFDPLVVHLYVVAPPEG